MKIKVNKHKLNIHYRGSPWGSRTQQHAYCLRYAHSQHTESHLGKKQPQAKIPIAFLFSQLHFNNVTSHALFDGGYLGMRNKRCAVQSQEITLITKNENSREECLYHECSNDAWDRNHSALTHQHSIPWEKSLTCFDYRPCLTSAKNSLKPRAIPRWWAVMSTTAEVIWLLACVSYCSFLQSIW